MKSCYIVLVISLTVEEAGGGERDVVLHSGLTARAQAVGRLRLEIREL